MMASYTVREVAEQFLELYADRRRWTKNYNARNKHGAEVLVGSREAVKWCLVGAQERMARAGKVPSAIMEQFSAAKKAACNALYGDPSEVYVNDQHGLAAVRAVLRRAGGIE